MKFADQAVERAVMKAIADDGMDADGQLDSIHELYIDGAESLADLLCCSGLHRLYISHSALKDAEILSRLTQLTELSLIDVSGVKSGHIAPLMQLKSLYVDDCGPWEAQPLSGLTRLQELTLQDTGMDDISCFQGMTRLQRLSLRGNPVRDASVLLGMKHLRHLSMDLDHLKDRRVLADKRVYAALDALVSDALNKFVCADLPENAPSSSPKAAKRSSMPRLEYLADVHSRVYFCRDAALVRLKGGLEKLVCRDYGPGKNQESYDLFLDGVPLVETYIPGCGTCGTRLWAGYGDGLMKQEECLAVRDRLNAGYDGLRKSLDGLAPLVGLMKSGLYLVADFDLFPVQRSGSSFDYFWDVPSFSSELHFNHWYVGGGRESLDAPLFLAPSQRASQMNPAQAKHYRQRLCEGEQFPRAVALYLNGGVALLLDGHHKAAACAAEGVPVKTLVIFPVDDVKKLEAALADGKRLYFHHAKGWDSAAAPLILRDSQGEELARVSCLETMRKKRVFAEPLEKVEWGRVPDEYRTQKFMNYPNDSLLSVGTLVQPDQVRSLIEAEMPKAKGTYEMAAISCLQFYAELFPDSKWLSASERAWLDRPWYEFEE